MRNRDGDDDEVVLSAVFAVTAAMIVNAMVVTAESFILVLQMSFQAGVCEWIRFRNCFFCCAYKRCNDKLTVICFLGFLFLKFVRTSQALDFETK